MRATSYAFKVGRIDGTVLLDGVSVVGAAGMVRRYPDATEAEYRQAYADLGLSLDAAESSLNVLAARIGDETVLVDAGEGSRPNRGYLPASMRLAGIAPESISLVVITHTHGDHVLGLLSNDHTPVFPHATYVMSKAEWAFWQDRIVAGAVDHGPIAAMLEACGLRLIDMDEPILPGLAAVPIPGHTPGQIAVLLESEQEQLMHLADLLHSPMQFAHPEWSASFDVDTSISVPTRRAALARVADAKMLTLFYHLAFPGLGRVRRAATGFIWEPLETEV
ncbi:MAG TPA: MBL fold metallo-hydrolase [Herpetosiphonaceae bacterium]